MGEKKSTRLSALLKIEEAKQHEEGRKLSGYQKAVQDKKKKLSELETYLDEYREKFAELARRGTEAEKIRSCYAFISQLNTIILHQRQAVREATHSVESYRQVWIQAKQRTDILEKTLGKIRDDELRHERKQEQALTDELARHKQRDH